MTSSNLDFKVAEGPVLIRRFVSSFSVDFLHLNLPDVQEAENSTPETRRAPQGGVTSTLVPGYMQLFL